MQLALVCFGLLAGAGCAERGGVTSYTVKSVAQRTPRPAAERPSQAWFFRLLGPQAAVDQQAENFARIIASLRFDPQGNPAWDLPEGWKQRAERGFRFATLTHDGDPPLEISVSSLPAEAPGSDPYLKANIDRWRGQVGLEPYAGDDWKQRAEAAGELRETTAGDARVILVHLKGTAEGQPVTLLAAIIPQEGAAARSQQGPAHASSSDDAPSYDAPAEWSPQPPRQFQTALWTVSSGDQKVEISVSRSGGSLEANVARWRRQVGLAADSTDNQVLEPQTVDGRPGTRVELNGPEQTILGLIVPQGDSAWFFKMMGPRTLVDQERERFQQFVESLRFPAGESGG